MGALREYLGALLAICLVATLALLLPGSARANLDRVCREGLIMPAQVLTSWFLRQAWEFRSRREVAAAPADPALHAQFLERRWEAIRPLPGGRGLRSLPLYRVAFDLALREHFEPLHQFRRAPVLCRRAELFREGIRLGCGRREHILPGAPVFNPEGYLVGLVDSVTPLTSIMNRLGADHVVLYCDVLGRDGVQGLLVGDWQQRSPRGPEARAGALELQISCRGTAVSNGDLVVTSSFGATPVQWQLPGGIPVGWVDGVEPTEEGFVRARVRVTPIIFIL